jgi:2,4-dienoyl-CoA reductase-like NADH-dependent reductase (Old Yellow Enzyme family)
MYGAAALAGWREAAAQVHQAGGMIVPQLWHQGAMRQAGTGPHPGAESVRPSGIWGPLDRTAMATPDYLASVAAPTRPVSDSEIADIVAGFARSARHAVDAGFDGIALHGAHGYLLDTFLWHETNLRIDRWGGDRCARSRFGADVVAAIRAAVGPDPVILFRFSQWKQQDVRARLAETPSELEAVLGPLADAGIDLFDASQRYFDKAEFAGSSLNLAGWAKRVTGRPSMTVGGVGLGAGVYDSAQSGVAAPSANVYRVAERLDKGEFDLVGVGRSLLHDPTWTMRLREGRPFAPYSEASRAVLT